MCQILRWIVQHFTTLEKVVIVNFKFGGRD